VIAKTTGIQILLITQETLFIITVYVGKPLLKVEVPLLNQEPLEVIFGKNAINKYDTTTIAKIHKPKPTQPFLRILAGTLANINTKNKKYD
jgi:hypothetical protein